MTSQPIPATATKTILCRAEEVAEGRVIRVEHGDLALAVYKVEGDFFVTSDLCTHGPGLLSEGELCGHIIECNFHGGQFDIRTGEVAGPPCMVPVQTYPVTVEDGQVVIEI